MKPEIHPDYHEITVVMVDGKEFKTRSTWGKEGDVLKLEIDAETHPAWTGGADRVIEKGQLSKFESRYGNIGMGAGKKKGAESPKEEAPKEEIKTEEEPSETEEKSE